MLLVIPLLPPNNNTLHAVGCHYFRERYSYRRQKIEAGDVVEVCLQFGCGPPKVTFFVNDMAVGNVEMQNVEGGSIYPAAELASSNAEVLLRELFCWVY